MIDPGAYRATIGLEIHVALNTRSKMFCGCSTDFGAPPNTNVCPVCLGLPGSLPVTNSGAVNLGIIAARALGSQVRTRSHFERKNYHYPDLPKGYQISQYSAPLAVGGELVLDDVEGEGGRIGITRVHLEEDAGKSTHSADKGSTLLDFNRCGVPLAEIVTEPHIQSPGQARRFLEELRALLRVVGVSEVRMEEGELRCDVNFNLVRCDEGEGPVRTEISEVKNLNSFRSVQRASEYELKRHVEAVSRGDVLEHETRHWDEERGVTYSARSKEMAHDYRYFPDPDLPPLVIDPGYADHLAGGMPEPPRAKRIRFADEFGLSRYDAAVLVADPPLADFFEETVSHGASARAAARWITGEVAAHLNASGAAISDVPASPAHLAELLELLEAEQISEKVAKRVWRDVFESGTMPRVIVERECLAKIDDPEELRDIVSAVIAENPDAAAEYSSGKDRAIGYLVGKVMEDTRGRADPRLVNDILRDMLRSGS